jgi:transcriptional regulator with XRE-family HTH domain
MSEFREFLEEQLQNPEFRREWDALEPEFAIVQALIDARKNVGLTQKQLSERTGIAQSDISKLESGDGNPSLKTLKRLAAAMDMTLKIEFTPSAGSNRDSMEKVAAE